MWPTVDAEVLIKMLCCTSDLQKKSGAAAQFELITSWEQRVRAAAHSEERVIDLMLYPLHAVSAIAAVLTIPPGPLPLPTAPRPSPTVLVATPSPTATSTPTAQPAGVFVPNTPSGPLQDASGIGALISSSKRSYRIDEPVMLRLSLHNSGDRSYTRPWIEPWFVIRLVIVDEDGEKTEAVGRESHSTQLHEAINHPGVIKPGESMELVWESKSEFPLSFWDVTLPRGRYTIQAIPEVENASSTVDHSIRSNSIHIRVK